MRAAASGPRDSTCTSARGALRAATAEIHLRTHGLAPFAALAGGRLSRTGYAGLLCSLIQFHTAIAVAAERFGWSRFSSSAERLQLLVADLDYLRVAPPSAPVRILSLGSAESAIGAIYVAEGSMIGGKLIAAQVDYLLGSGPDGRSFFSGRGQADSLAWRRLVEVIEDRLTPVAALDAAIAGAIGAFELFEGLVSQTATAAYSPGLTRNCSMRPLTGS